MVLAILSALYKGPVIKRLSPIIFILLAVFWPQAYAGSCKADLEVRGIGGLHDYTLTSEGIELNPSTRFLRQGKTIVQLSELEYEVFENIVFGDKPFSRTEFERIQESVFKKKDRDFSLNYLNTVVNRIAKKLKKNFGKDLASRIVPLTNKGFIWIDTPAPENIQADRFWFHPEKNYLYFGAEYVHLSGSLLSFVQLLKENDCRPKSLAFLNIHLAIDSGTSELSMDDVRILRTRLGAAFGKRAKGKIIKRSGLDHWALNPELFAGCPPRLFEAIRKFKEL